MGNDYEESIFFSNPAHALHALPEADFAGVAKQSKGCKNEEEKHLCQKYPRCTLLQPKSEYVPSILETCDHRECLFQRRIIIENYFSEYLHDRCMKILLCLMLSFPGHSRNLRPLARASLVSSFGCLG